MNIVAVIPTYNEAENIVPLIDALFTRFTSLKVVIVDDNSPDGTGGIARGHAARCGYSVDVITRPGKLGLGTAYMVGFNVALKMQADLIVQMDADFSHTIADLDMLITAAIDADVAVGSRYVSYGLAPEWPWYRRALSSWGNGFLRAVLHLQIRDVSSGFKVFRPSVLEAIDYNAFKCHGYGFQVEMARACERAGLIIEEVPITFRDRARGKSKMSLGVLFETAWRLLR